MRKSLYKGLGVRTNGEFMTAMLCIPFIIFIAYTGAGAFFGMNINDLFNF